MEKFTLTSILVVENFNTDIGRVRRVTSPMGGNPIWQKPYVRDPVRDPMAFEFHGTEWVELDMTPADHPAGEGDGAKLERLYRRHYALSKKSG